MHIFLNFYRFHSQIKLSSIKKICDKLNKLIIKILKNKKYIYLQ